MADERDVYRAAADDRDAPLRDEDPGRAKPPKSPPPQPYHTATALSSLESRLEESEARRIDSEERVQQLEKLVEGLLKSSPEPAAARAGVSEPAVARAGFSEPAAARAGEFTFTPRPFTTDRVIQLVATLFVRFNFSQAPSWTSLAGSWLLPDRVSHDFYGCRQSSSRAYDHVGEWRARYRAFMHNDPSFSLSPLQLATTFYQSLSDVAKREVRAGMLREYRDNSLVTIGRFGRTVPSLEEVTDWAAIADDTGTTSVSTPPIRTATYGAIAKTPRTAPSTPNDDARTQIRRARWMNRAGKWQQAHL
ncbi:BZ3500_MvSof-1268-A1-R1_C124g00672 [Microbotryum saponariae]|uniref:BZ3500_MvSof-1268-A1-R1_C124g00672 protein n=1 Tax=Microbotryum saponariae TaxID=289078 RepID=A0A2X0LGH8_9BASI|nr:BZ3500_MvSof-1268-A1-R1_C124g00672 [Microbotryum saponariae]